MSSRVILKPSVYKYDDHWVAELDHISWAEGMDFDTWEAALEHALWLNASANG
jgi:hypothetical protein